MSATTTRGYPYPQLTDGVDVPGDLQDLATAIDADVESVADVDICHLIQAAGAAQTGWTNATLTAVTFGTGSTVVDTLSIHSESSNTSRLVIGKKLGWWEVDGNYCPIANSGNSSIRAVIAKNGTAVNGSFGGGSGGTSAFWNVKTATIEVLASASGDYIELQGYQDSSVSRGTSVSSYVSCSIRARWVREA